MEFDIYQQLVEHGETVPFHVSETVDDEEE